MKNNVSRGLTVLFIAAAGLASGTPHLVGRLFGFVQDDTAEGAEGVLVIAQAGYDCPKKTGSGESYTQGAAVYFDAATATATTNANSGANLEIGVALEAAGE